LYLTNTGSGCQRLSPLPINEPKVGIECQKLGIGVIASSAVDLMPTIHVVAEVGLKVPRLILSLKERECRPALISHYFGQLTGADEPL